MKKLLFAFFLFVVSFAKAQDGYLSGMVVDKDNGEPLPFATVKVFKDTVSVKTIVTDFDGLFAVDIPMGTYRLNVRILGYDVHDTTVIVNKPDFRLLRIGLSKEGVILESVQNRWKIKTDQINPQMTICESPPKLKIEPDFGRKDELHQFRDPVFKRKRCLFTKRNRSKVK
ncbi:MAG: hypothetical protein RL757_2559 [Bacteroidota bacterium]|jgi:hypothetical protein